MRRYTTPIEELTVEDIDLTLADIYVTLKQGDRKLTYTGNQLGVEYNGKDTVISLHLAQEESGSFAVGSIWVQVNWTLDGERNATEKVRVEVQDNLHDSVI